MARWMLRAALFGPALLVLVFVAERVIERRRVDALVQGPETLRWGRPPNEIEAHLRLGEAAEQQRYSLSLTRSGAAVYTEEGAISWDLFSGGFVGVMNVDADSERELVVYGSLVRGGQDEVLARSHYLDGTSGAVEVLPFDVASEEAKEVARRWMQSHVMMGLEIAGSVFFLLLYYGVLVVVLLVVRTFGRGRKTTSVTASGGPSGG